jgi:uncharacterized membrane protein YhaH (DUF805 family)
MTMPVSDASRRKCPQCFNEISGNPGRCPLCGSPIAPASSPRPPPESQSGNTVGTTESNNGAGISGVKTQATQSTQKTTSHQSAQNIEKLLTGGSPPGTSNFSASVRASVLNWYDVKSRLPRQQYGQVFMATFLLWIIAFPLLTTLSGSTDFAGEFLIILSVPFITASVRRLHDVNRSGHLLWLYLTVVAIPYLIIELAKPGDTGANRFGPASNS